MRFILHWFGQGVKLWFFACLSWICIVPFFLLPDFFSFPDLVGSSRAWASWETIAVFLVHLPIIIFSVAIFTAIFARLLGESPLRPYRFKKTAEPDPEEAPYI